MPAIIERRNTCKICKSELKGRADKLFCSLECKNYYHVNLRSLNTQSEEVQKIDRILHRNRTILLEILGKNKQQKKINRVILDHKNFKFDYHTRTYKNSKGKTYNYIYDVGWMQFSDREVLVLRKKL
jgi:hypothetical protein